MADVQTAAAPQPTPPGEPVGVRGFKGLNNRADPVALGLEWLLQADNVLVDDAGYLVRRPGIAPLATGFKDIYGTRGGRLLLVTAADGLVERSDDGTTTPLATGLTGAPFCWVELGTALFVQSATAAWAIYPDRVIPWGSLCPGGGGGDYPVGDPVSYPPPRGSVLGSRRSQTVVGVWEPERDRSVLYTSRPDYPHEFRLERDFTLVAGRITVLAEVPTGLVIGTDRAVYVDPIDAPLVRVADYGVPAGGHVYDDHGQVVLWTERGLCRALPFENLTEQRLVPGNRVKTTAGLLSYRGSSYAVVSMTGPLASKKLARPTVPLAVVTDAQGITSI